MPVAGAAELVDSGNTGIKSCSAWLVRAPQFLTRVKLQHIILTDKCHDLGEQSCPASFDFRPLLAHPTLFADLDTLILFPDFRSSSIALTDSDILTLARTCPNLNALELRLRNTPVSLYTLGILVGRCRELREVSLCVDARLDALGAIPPINDNDKREVDLQPNTRLIKLDIGGVAHCVRGPLAPSDGARPDEVDSTVLARDGATG